MAARSATRPDLATFGGLAIAMAGIVGGLLLEKGAVQDLAQVTGLLIVLGGTVGAVLISTPYSGLMCALRRSRIAFFTTRLDETPALDTILKFAAQARRRGIIFLEEDAHRVTDPFLRKGLLLAVDGVPTDDIRRSLELDLHVDEEHAEADARVFELAGGYAPTVGIIGAVLGLIQVMKHLKDTADLGGGIAMAFVATLYGVGLANLLLLPIAAKIRRRARMEAQHRELLLEGVMAIAERLNPESIRLNLEGHLGPSQKAPAHATAANGTGAKQTQ